MADVVLIAEDDENIVELLRLYLSGSGYEVRCAHDGAEALEILRTDPVSIALVDLMMPKLNGYDLIRQARSFTNVPIVIVSARTQAVDKIVGLDAGADGYITKPFDPLEVTAYIRAVPGARTRRRARRGTGGAAPAHRAFAPPHARAKAPQPPARTPANPPRPPAAQVVPARASSSATLPLTPRGSCCAKTARPCRSPQPSSRSCARSCRHPAAFSPRRSSTRSPQERPASAAKAA